MLYDVVTAENGEFVIHYTAPSPEAALAWGYRHFPDRADWVVRGRQV